MPLRMFLQGVTAGIWLVLAGSATAQPLPLSVPYEVPGVTYSRTVPTPEEVVGHTIGTSHTRPDEVVSYFQAVAAASNRVTVAEYGRTFENRPLIYALVSAPRNLSNIEAIRTANLDLSDHPSDVADRRLQRMPAIVSAHFTVHGNEASGTEAAMLLLYHLAAGIGERVDSILDSTVVIIDPVINPDGRARFVEWVNSNRGGAPNADPADREHSEPWPSGRTNHYWFDLNRDWLTVQQPESKARLALFHHWRPQVLLDVHEMGGDQTFFFQPGVPSRGNPNTPQRTFELTEQLTRSSAHALDRIGSLYYSKESYDDFFYGKGSTFPDINGSVGILFEQGSSRALETETEDGVLAYGFTIRNQLAATIGLLEGAARMRVDLLRNQRDFYEAARHDAAEAGFTAWLIGSEKDRTRAEELISVLLQHRIVVRPVKTETTVDAKTFEPGSAWAIPVDQRQYRLIKSSMERVTTFRDSIFYDVSTWTLPLAFGVQTAEFDGKVDQISADPIDAMDLDGGGVHGGVTDYAYVMPWGEYYAPRALYKLLAAGIPARVALEPFETVSDGGSVYFERGAIVVPIHARGDGLEHPLPDRVRGLVSEVAADDHVDFYAIDGGLTQSGIDVGSPRTVPLHAPSIAIFSGSPLSGYRVGEAWYLLSERMDIPTSLIDLGRAAEVDLRRYDVLILADGDFSKVDTQFAEQLRTWVEKGGRLIAMQRAAKWTAGVGIAAVEFPEEEKPDAVGWVGYGDRKTVEQARDISGAIFEVDLDHSHPIAFGLGDRMALFKTHYSVLKPPTVPGAVVAVYRPDPLLSGYAPADRVARIARSAAAVGLKVGKGRVVLIQDVPTFRAFWYGSDLLFLNAILFGEAY